MKQNYWRSRNTSKIAFIMILEVAILDVIPGQEKEFKTDFKKAQSIIFSMTGGLWCLIRGNSSLSDLTDRSERKQI